MPYRLLPVALLLALFTFASAAPPPELASLQQTYSFAFAERVSAIPDLPRSMRAFAERALDWRVKVPLFSRFAEELVARPRRIGH